DGPRPRLLEKTAEFEVLVVHETVRLRPDVSGTITSVVDLFLIETGEFDGRRTITRDVRFALDDGTILIADLCDPEEVHCVLPRNLVMWPEPTPARGAGAAGVGRRRWALARGAAVRRGGRRGRSGGEAGARRGGGASAAAWVRVRGGPGGWGACPAPERQHASQSSGPASR